MSWERASLKQFDHHLIFRMIVFQNRVFSVFGEFFNGEFFDFTPVVCRRSIRLSYWSVLEAFATVCEGSAFLVGKQIISIYVIIFWDNTSTFEGTLENFWIFFQNHPCVMSSFEKEHVVIDFFRYFFLQHTSTIWYESSRWWVFLMELNLETRDLSSSTFTKSESEEFSWKSIMVLPQSPFDDRECCAEEWNTPLKILWKSKSRVPDLRSSWNLLQTTSCDASYLRKIQIRAEKILFEKSTFSMTPSEAYGRL